MSAAVGRQGNNNMRTTSRTTCTLQALIVILCWQNSQNSFVGHPGHRSHRGSVKAAAWSTFSVSTRHMRLRGGAGEDAGKREASPKAETRNKKRRSTVEHLDKLALGTNPRSSNSTESAAVGGVHSFVQPTSAPDDSGDTRLQSLINAQAAELQKDVGTSDSISTGSNAFTENHEDIGSYDAGAEGLAKQSRTADEESEGDLPSSGWLDDIEFKGSEQEPSRHVDNCPQGGNPSTTTNQRVHTSQVPRSAEARALETVGCKSAGTSSQRGQADGQGAPATRGSIDEHSLLYMGTPTLEMWLGAAAQGDTHLLASMLSKSPQALEWADERGRTALHFVSSCSRGLGALEQLVAAGADVHVLDKQHRTCLHLAAAAGYSWIARKLAEAGCPVNALDMYNRSALMLACWQGSLKSVLTLLALKADPLLRDRHACSALHIAAWKGHQLIISQLLAAADAQVGRTVEAGGGGGGVAGRSDIGAGGAAPLEDGINSGDMVVTVDCRDDGGGTPLHKACLNGHVAAAELLLARAAAVNARDSNMCSALHLAASRGHAQLAAMLVDKGAELEAEDASGKTPLHWAAARGQVAAAEVLCRVGASCEARDILEKTPLHLAAHAGHASFVDFLIAGCGCDVGAQDVFNATAAHFAARFGRGHVLELLIQGGSKLEALDAAMWSPLHWAETHNHSHICARLRSLGCSTGGEPVSPNSLPDVDDLVDMASGPLADLRRVTLSNVQIKANFKQEYLEYLAQRSAAPTSTAPLPRTSRSTTVTHSPAPGAEGSCGSSMGLEGAGLVGGSLASLAQGVAVDAGGGEGCGGGVDARSRSACEFVGLTGLASLSPALSSSFSSHVPPSAPLLPPSLRPFGSDLPSCPVSWK